MSSMTENYKIVADMTMLENFIVWLPNLEPHEKFYLCLFARKKYCPSVPWIKSDKSQLKRFCSDKERMIMKIKQLECPLGWYKQYSKDGEILIPQEALAVYITSNPRNLWKATFEGMKKFAQLIETNGAAPSVKQECPNIHQEAMSCIQRSCSRKVRIPFDIDNPAVDVIERCIDIVDGNCDVLKTRGGFHIFVYPNDLKTNDWYRKIAAHADVTGDNMMPIPGCYQGGFIPSFIFKKGDTTISL